MPYEIFFSYRRSDFGPFMREFLSDLGEEVRKLRGLGKYENLSFFDQESIETGNNWDDALLAAMQESRVLIPLYSPAYFNSEYCGKEWQSFQLRREAYAKLHGGIQPAVIRPVVWIPLRKDKKLALPNYVSAAVRMVQYTWREEDSHINQQGLEHMVRKKADYNDLYWDFVRGFAQGITDALDGMELPHLNPMPTLNEIAPAFPLELPATRPAVHASARQGFRRHVRFVFAALHPEHLSDGRNRNPYQDAGGPDWKPFYPDLQRRIGALAAHIVSDADLDFDSDQAQFSKGLADEVRAAFKEGKPVVVFVDRWSLYASPDYQEIFREFDEQNFNNCAVLLPWNPRDPELAANKSRVDQVIRDVLRFRCQYAQSSPYYCRDVASLDELRDTLRTVLNQIQAEMRRSAPVRNVPGGIGRPIIMGPGAREPRNE
ncbi:hypothetical protein YTPLAS18_29600 [Nitrospira sp.]|nr:hypothetical protein YTPLAS18_29600 [Nitrospira sp.]